MSWWEFIGFSAGVIILVILTYKATGGTCKWFGHDWKRVSMWDREYQCRYCGESRG